MNACPKYGHLLAQVATLTSAVKLEQEQQFLIAKKLQVDFLPCLFIAACDVSSIVRRLVPVGSSRL